MPDIDWDEPAEYVAERLREAIATEPDVHELGITVTVAGGRVLLSGSASTPTQRTAITTLVQRLAPADLEVVNDVEVPSTSQPTDTEDLG
jgi:osmotically-inducible protein OsmY